VTTQNIYFNRVDGVLLMVATISLIACDPNSSLEDEVILEVDQQATEQELDISRLSEDVDVGFQLSEKDMRDLGLDADINPDDFVDGYAIDFDDDLILVSDIVSLAEETLAWAGSFWFGNNLWAESYDIVQGPSYCPGGASRSYAVATVTSGHGSCHVLGWVSYAPYDCRVFVRINAPGWFHGGVCSTWIYAQ
jgi:hypothetical protein